jgi:hypothetical protein
MMHQIWHLGLASRSLLALVAVLAMTVVIEVSVLGKGDIVDEAMFAEMADVEEFLLDVKDATPLSAPPLSAYSDITGRPLFNENRRPIVADVSPSATPQATTQLSKQWKLTGIVMAGNSSFVLVEGKRDHRTIRLQKGAMLDGWRLDEISAGHIDLMSGTKTASLILHEKDRKNQ